MQSSAVSRSITLVVWLGFLAGPAIAADKIAPAEMEADMPYDLGPATVDVSKYPAEHQKGYQLFQQRCTLCHTAARALNFPMVDRSDWMRFVMRMHGRAGGYLVSTEDAQSIANFLAYDSARRKADSEAFSQLQTQLEERFAQIKQERARRLQNCK